MTRPNPHDGVEPYLFINIEMLHSAVGSLFDVRIKILHCISDEQ